MIQEAIQELRYETVGGMDADAGPTGTYLRVFRIAVAGALPTNKGTIKN